MSVIWITGVSGSGKTTLARALRESLVQQNKRPIIIDGDEVRDALIELAQGIEAFSPLSRKKFGMTYARLAKMLSDQGFIVIVATISLFHAIHAWNRRNNETYIEVLLSVSLSDVERRDPKGLYAKSVKRGTPNIVGRDIRFQLPKSPDIQFKNFAEADLGCMVAAIIEVMGD